MHLKIPNIILSNCCPSSLFQLKKFIWPNQLNFQFKIELLFDFPSLFTYTYAYMYICSCVQIFTSPKANLCRAVRVTCGWSTGKPVSQEKSKLPTNSSLSFTLSLQCRKNSAQQCTYIHICRVQKFARQKVSSLPMGFCQPQRVYWIFESLALTRTFLLHKSV